jgi:hypothetical protein
VKSPLLPLAAILSLALLGCSQESSEKPESKKDAAPVATTPAPDPEAARIAENARLDAIHTDCLKSPPTADAQALPLIDGLYKQVPRNKTFTSTWWLSKTQTALLAEPREGAAQTATLPPQTWVEVAEDIAYTVPTRGVVLEPGQGFDLKQCDIVYEIDSEDGEGASTKWVWSQGRVFTLDSDDGHADAEALRAPFIAWGWAEQSDQTPMSPAAAARFGQWVRLKAPDGKTGWTRNGSIDFDCIWENDRYLNDQPTQCAKYPGATAKP